MILGFTYSPILHLLNAGHGAEGAAPCSVQQAGAKVPDHHTDKPREGDGIALTVARIKFRAGVTGRTVFVNMYTRGEGAFWGFGAELEPHSGG